MRIRKRLATISAGFGGPHHLQRSAAGSVSSPPRLPVQFFPPARCNISSRLHLPPAEKGSSKSPSHVDKKQVDMVTTAASTVAPFPTNATPTSPVIPNEDHVNWPEHMSIDEESGVHSCTAWEGNNRDLQRLARDLIRINVKASIKASVCNEDKVLKSVILHETSANFKQNNARINGNGANHDAIHNVEEKEKQGQGGGEDERCCRRSGRGWQCKNKRAADGSSIYCNYHQFKIHKNHASWNARIKTMKENKRKRKITESEASFQPQRNKMVEVKMFELPLLPSKQHMYENVQAHDAISSEAGAIFKRMFQAAASTEKQGSSKMGTDHNVKPLQRSTTLPNLVDTVVALPARPSTQHAQINSESRVLGSFNYKGRRVEKAAEAPEYTAVDAEESNYGCNMSNSSVEHGVDEYCDGHKEELDQEITRCKRMDGKGWQCRNMHGPNSSYCYHHQIKISKYHQKRVHKRRSLHVHLVTGINPSSATPSTINPSCSVQASEDGDSSNLQRETDISMEEDQAQNEKHENGYQEEKWPEHASETRKNKNQQGLAAGFQDCMEHGLCDMSAHNVLHFWQLQQEQLQWWKYKQGGKDSTPITEDHKRKHVDLLLPRRSERRLIINICKLTAAEHAKEYTAGTREHDQQSNDILAANNDELQLQPRRSHMIPAKPDSHNILAPMQMKDAHKLQNTEQQQCKRHDGRGWQCKRMCMPGKSYCEHHVEMQRNYVEKTDGRSKGKLQRVAKHAALQISKENIRSNEPDMQTIAVKKMDCEPQIHQVYKGSCRVWTDMGRSSAKHGSHDVQELQLMEVQRGPHKNESYGGQKSRAESQGSRKYESNNEVDVHKQEHLTGAKLPEEKYDEEEQELKRAEAHEGQHRCGRHDGRGWQCKSMCKQGSLYCEYHREKLRRNHATWNAKKLQEKRSNGSLHLAAAKRKVYCVEEEAAIAVPAQQAIEDEGVQEKVQEIKPSCNSSTLLPAAGTTRKLCMEEGANANAPAGQVSESTERKVQENMRTRKKPLVKKKTRSLKDIVARSHT